MKVTGSTIQQLDKLKPSGKPIPKSECRRWRLWATTECGRKSERFNGTYTQAQERLRAFVAELEAMVPNPERFRAYAEKWRKWRAADPDVDEQTACNDKRNISVLNRAFGDDRMDSITPSRVKDGLLALRNGGSSSGKTLSGTYMNNLYTALNSIMRSAEDDGLIAKNPCSKVKPPKCDTKERKALTSEQMDALWESLQPMIAQGDSRAMVTALILEMGLRPQEAVALRPEDVDADNAMIHVARGMKEKTGNIGKTKRPSSVRDLPMTGRMVEACRTYAPHRTGGSCFCENSRDGGPLRQQNYRRWWNEHREGFGLPGFIPYELRHSNLTKMARYMTAYDLQDWAGWSSIAPAKTYVHRDASSLREAVERAQRGERLTMG